MATVRVTKKTLANYERCLKDKGELGLYCSIVGEGFNSRVHNTRPEVTILDRSDAFFALYRRTGNEDYFIIGKVLRRAAHRLYRQFNKMEIDRPINGRFLNLVSNGNN